MKGHMQLLWTGIYCANWEQLLGILSNRQQMELVLLSIGMGARSIITSWPLAAFWLTMEDILSNWKQ
jgi:hypothetical protein